MKPIFSRNIDIDKNADLNWPMDTEDSVQNYEVLSNGYLDASLTMLKDLLRDNSGHRADALIFPVLFCTYQYIELVLKAILKSNNQLEYKADHDIRNYFQNVIQLLVCEGKTQAEVENHLSIVSEFIDEIYKNIKYTNVKGKSCLAFEYARFPLGNDGITSLFYVKNKSDLITIDLVNYLGLVMDISDKLSGILQMYRNREESKL